MATPTSLNGNVIFIDTNLDTHLVLTVSDHDTVSDLKKRIVSEHTSCFPKVGQIQIHGIKVKRRGYFYHLSDSMVVRTAFIGFNKNWFLSVDVSALGECKQNDHLFSHASIDIANNDLIGSPDNAIVLPSNHQLQLLENKQDEVEGIPVVRAEGTDKDAVTNLEAGVKSSGNRSHLNHEVPSFHMECDVDGIGKGNKDYLNDCEEELSVSVQSGKKKKRKSKRKREYDTVGDDKSKEEIPSVHPCVSELTEKNAVKNLEMDPSLPSARKKHKSKREKDGTMEGDNSKDNIAYVNNPVGCPSERASSFNNFQGPENKNDEKEEIPIDCPCVSEHTEKAVKNLEMVQNSYIECDVDGSNKGIKDGHIECEEGTSEPTPKAKKKKLKSTRKKEETVGGNNSKDNIASVDNPLGCPSEKASSFNNLQGPQLENKPDEKEEIPFDRPCVPEHTGKEAVLNSEMVPNSRIECEEGTSEPTPKAKKNKHKSTRKKEDTVGGSNSKDNIAFVDSPSEKASSFNNFQGPQSENKPDKKEEIPFDRLCVPEHTEKEAVKNLEMVPNLRFECVVDGSNEAIKDDRVVNEEGTSGPAPRTKKKKHKNKKRKEEDTVGDNNSKDNIASVDNPLSCPSEKASSFNNFQVSQSENKLDEKEVPFDCPRVPEHTEKEAVKKLEMIPNLHIECEADGSNEAIKDDHIVCEEGTSEPAAAKKKKHKSKRKKKDTVGGDNSKENDASVVVPVQQDITVPIISSENADKEVTKGTEVLEEHWHTKNDDKALSMKEASELSPAVKKEHKKRKRSLAHDSREPLNVATESQKDQAQMSDGAHGERKESNDQSELNNYKSGDDVVHKNNKTEDILDTRSPAKKRKKSKERSKEKILSDKKLVNDFDVDNSSHHLLEGQQNIKNRKADQSTEHFNDGDQDEKADHFSTQREGVQEEIPVDRPLSKDIIMNKMTPGKMEIGTDACKESIQSTTKETGNHKNQSDIEMEIQPSDVNEPKDLMEDNENVVLGHCHESEVGQIEGAEEGVEASPQNDSKLMPSERCIRSESNQDKTNANIRELKATSNVVDVNGMKEPLKPGKEKKGIKIVKNKGGGQTLRDDKGLVNASESETFIAKSLQATVCDPMPGNAETPRSPLNQTEGKVMQQEEMQGTVLSGADMEGQFSMGNSDSLEQAKTKSNAENVGKRPKNKSNSKQASSSKDTSDMVTNGHVFDSKKRDVHRIDKAPNALKTRKLSSQSESAMSSIDENRKSCDNASGRMDVEKQRDRTPISNSKLAGFNQIVQNSRARKTSRNHVIGVNNTQQKKSLLEGAIFKDDSSSASEDEDEDQVDNSDASTRTPSINSLASDFLDGYDSPGLDSQQNGSHDGKSLENSKGSSLKASLSDTKGMSIDCVLRSSSRYKKAKIIASQLDESESQPDFVPDSFADM